MTHLPVKVKIQEVMERKMYIFLFLKQVVCLGALTLDTQYGFTAQWYSTVFMALIFRSFKKCETAVLFFIFYFFALWQKLFIFIEHNSHFLHNIAVHIRDHSAYRRGLAS
jgi:hypothetical protein